MTFRSNLRFTMYKVPFAEFGALWVPGLKGGEA